MPVFTSPLSEKCILAKEETSLLFYFFISKWQYILISKTHHLDYFSQGSRCEKNDSKIVCGKTAVYCFDDSNRNIRVTCYLSLDEKKVERGSPMAVLHSLLETLYIILVSCLLLPFGLAEHWALKYLLCTRRKISFSRLFRKVIIALKLFSGVISSKYSEIYYDMQFHSHYLQLYEAVTCDSRFTIS